MNILVLSWRDPRHPLAGGAEQVMHEHMKGWVQAGHSVTFFSSHPKNTPEKEAIDGIKIIRKGSQYLTVHISAFFWYLFGRHPRFDLVIDQFHGWPFFTPLYIRVPKIAVIQELTRHVWFRYPLPYGLNYLLGSIGYLIEPLFFIFYKNVPFITGSDSAKKELQTVGIKSNQITVIPHGVIIKTPKKNYIKETIPTIVFLGALASDKGIEDAIKAFGILSKKRKYQFWIIGKGDDKYISYLKSLTKNVGISKATTFWGFVNQEKKFELLARAHLMINPSIREGWGLVNIEANAMGTPVVAYNSPGLTDSVQHKKTGIIVDKNSPKNLAESVETLLNNPNNYKGLQNEARNWSEKFEWKNSQKISLDLIEKIYAQKNI